MRAFKRVFVAATFYILVSSAHADHPTLSVGSGTSAAITTTSAEPLGVGRKVISVEQQAIEFDPISDATLLTESLQHRHAHSTDRLHQVAVNGGFGLSDNLSVGFSLPYIRRNELREGAHHGHLGTVQLGDAAGIGDLQLYTHYRFMQAGNTNLAFIGGLKAPTGNTDESSDIGDKLDMELQPGSGSWDAFSGIAWSRQWRRWSINGNLLYTAVSEGDRDTDLGDIGNYNIAAVYRQTLDNPHGHEHRHHHEHKGIFIDYIVELNGEWRQRIDIDGEIEKNSGGNIVYLSPGVRLGLWRATSVTLAVGMPVIENLNGVQSEPQVRVVAGVTISI